MRSKSNQPRCSGCGLHLDLCLCPELPRLRVATRVVVVQHAVERFKPTGTARLLLQIVANSSLAVHGARDVPFAAGELTGTESESLLLFPHGDAMAIEEAAALPRRQRRRLVVLDGSWSQCSRMAQRIPALRSLRRVALAAGPPSPWTVRRTKDPARLCTFEATLRALALLERPSPALREAERAFQRVTARALYMRSRLATPERPDEWPLSIV